MGNNFGGGDDEDTLLFQTAPGPESSSPQKCSSSIVRNETSGYPARSFQHLNTENYGIKQGQVSLLGNNNFSVFRSEPGPSLPHAGIRSSPTLDTIEATIKTESFNKSAARDVVHPTMGQETEEIYDQGMVMFSAFDDIETKDFNENSSSDSDLEIYATDTLLTVSLQEEEIARIVRDHDLVYFSVNFGEVLIKEMLMCSMFGVQVSTSSALQGYKLQVERMTRIANALPAFTSLCKQDQVILTSHWLTILISDWSRWRC